MKQLLQHIRTGQATVANVPAPQAGPGKVLVRTAASLVLAGTERMVVDFAGKSLLQKAIIYPHQTERALIAILRRAPGWVELYRQVGEAALWQTAQQNEVASLVAHALQECSEDIELSLHWRQVHDATHRRISAYLTELDRIAGVLAEG